MELELIYPKVGIAIMVTNDYGEVLLGRRKGSHGHGVYAFPGGSLEYMESIEGCIYRELEEECGKDFLVTSPEFIRAYNLLEYVPKHFLDLAFRVKWDDGEAITAEPDKCESWNWYPMDELPTPLFFTIEEICDSYLKKRPYVKERV